MWPAREHGIYVDHNDFVYIAGNEIGEVGGKNSTAEELTAFVEVFNTQLAKLAPGKAWKVAPIDRCGS